jgi:hypothetical protein
MPTTCADTVSSEPTWAGGSSGEPTFTAITTSAWQRSRTSRTGRLSTRPPSTRRRPRCSCGDISPGTDMLARMAAVRLPWRITTRSPLPMSVATMDSGSGSASICGSPRSANTSRLKNSLIFWPDSTPLGARTPSGVRPSSVPDSTRCRVCLRRTLSWSCGGSSRNMSAQSAAASSSRIDCGVRPATQAPATRAPMLVPATQSTGTRRRSSTSSTPTCAAPRAPPPPSTRPMRGRGAVAAGPAACKPAGPACASDRSDPRTPPRPSSMASVGVPARADRERRRSGAGGMGRDQSGKRGLRL